MEKTLLDLEKTWRRPGDTGEDMELNKDTECLLNTVKKTGS